MARVAMEFFNLGQARLPLARAVALISAHHHAGGARVLVHCADELLAEELDRSLWSFDPASFLPHAQAGGPGEAEEPVLIAPTPANRNRAEVLILATPLDDPPLAAYRHVVQFVPSKEGPELLASRARYKRYRDGGEVELRHTTRVPPD